MMQEFSALALLRIPGKPVAVFAATEAIKARYLNELPNNEGFVYAPFAPGESPIWWLEPLHDIVLARKSVDAMQHALTESRFHSSSKENYELAASVLLKKLHTGNLEKVILSKIIVAPRPEFLDANRFFNALCEEYPGAAVHLFISPETGCWVGASPELLLSVEQQQLKTTSLAGTLPVHAAQSPKWTPKEMNEQQLVTDYISGVLKKEAGVTSVIESPAQTVSAGSVIHLRTDFSAKTDSVFNWRQLVANLHPTPAIAGLPPEAAAQAIEQTETHQRLYYGGFFGTAGAQHCHLFLNLRCMQITSNQMVLYAGGGYTVESDIQSEWNETEYKARTLLAVIEKLRNFESH
jgi:isochorismate synthase